jgi:hypothetical protein
MKDARRVGHLRRRVPSLVLTASFALTAFLATAPHPWQLAFVSRAHAYDAATTHAGLTQQAVIASHLHQVLTKRLGRSLGLFDVLHFEESAVAADRRSLWRARFGWLSADGGYRPDAGQRQPALGWILAGAVLSHVPATRARLHFWDPSTGRGLAQEGGAAAWSDSVGALFDEASPRGLVTGTAARREQPPAWAWLNAPENDEGLPSFMQGMADAVTLPSAEARETALVQGLLALGGILAVLEDLGEPAHVRNDLDKAFLAEPTGVGHATPFNRGSLYERWVADHLGQSGVPAASAPVSRPTFESYFVGADGEGLANRTQRRFFSVGTVPEDQAATSVSTPRGLADAAQASLTYALPRVGKLSFGGAGPRYVVEKEGDRVCRKLGYELGRGRLHFFLDDDVYADTAGVLLPEIGAYGAGLIDFLFRAEVALTLEGNTVTAAVKGTVGSLSDASLTLVAEDAQGKRAVIGTIANADAASASVPAGTRRVFAVIRGQDQRGPLTGLGQLSLSGPEPKTGLDPKAAMDPKAPLDPKARPEAKAGPS